MGNYNTPIISDIIDRQFCYSITGRVYADIINQIEKLVIEKALEQSDGNQLVDGVQPLCCWVYLLNSRR